MDLGQVFLHASALVAFPQGEADAFLAIKGEVCGKRVRVDGNFRLATGSKLRNPVAGGEGGLPPPSGLVPALSVVEVRNQGVIGGQGAIPIPFL